MPETTPDYSSGVALMLVAPADVARDCAVSGGVPLDDMHVTLAYFGDLDEDGEVTMTREDFERYAAEIAAGAQPFSADFNGLTRFSSSEDAHPLVVNVDAPELEQLRRTAFDSAPQSPKLNHGFTPHMTLAYLDVDEPTPGDPWTTKTGIISQLRAAYGPDETVHNLGREQANELTAAATPTQNQDEGTSGEDETALLPNQATTVAPNDTLAACLDESGNVLTLVFSDSATGKMYERSSGKWEELDQDADEDAYPDVWNREWVDIGPELIERYDAMAAGGSQVQLRNIANVTVDTFDPQSVDDE